MDEYIEEYSLSHKNYPQISLGAKRIRDSMNDGVNNVAFLHACNESAEFRRYYLNSGRILISSIYYAIQYTLENLSAEMFGCIMKTVEGCSKVMCQMYSTALYLMHVYDNERKFLGAVVFTMRGDPGEFFGAREFEEKGTPEYIRYERVFGNKS